MNVKFKIIEHGSPSWKDAVQLREKVLRAPLGTKFTELELAEEQNHLHIAGFINDTLVATAVLVPEIDKIKMQRVAVDHHCRNSNIGSQMMTFCEKQATTESIGIIYCHARDTAVSFYLKNNYKKVGAYFEEDGIPHLKMEKVLF